MTSNDSLPAEENMGEEDREFLAQLKASLALDPLDRVSTYEALAQKLEQELNQDKK